MITLPAQATQHAAQEAFQKEYRMGVSRKQPVNLSMSENKHGVDNPVIDLNTDAGQGTLVDNETPTGTISGSNATFVLAHTPVPTTSLQVFLNGMLQTAGGVDYTLAGATVTFVTAPTSLPASILRVFYRY